MACEKAIDRASADQTDAHINNVATSAFPSQELQHHPRTAEAPADVWIRLLDSGHGNFGRCFSPAGVRRCRVVSRVWKRLACDSLGASGLSSLPVSEEASQATGGLSGPTCEALWREDVGCERRKAAWKALLLGGITLQQKDASSSYGHLCETPCPYDGAIRRDVSRTLPREELFREKQGKGQLALFRILRALATRLWDIGYCQSLNFVVATLICVFPEDEAIAFQCAWALLLRYSLADLYRPKFPKLGVTVWQFDRLVEGFLPKVHNALQQHGVNAEYYALQWFLTLFAGDLPQPFVRRIWDRFLVSGWQAIVQTGLALLYSVQDILPTLDTCQALRFLKEFSRQQRLSCEDFLSTAASFQVSHRMLSALEAVYTREDFDSMKLFVIKDLNSGNLHWNVQAVAADQFNVSPRRSTDGDEDQVEPLPRAFSGGAPTSQQPQGDPGITTGPVLPFLLHNLDTGETEVMERAWTQYVHEAGASAGTGPFGADSLPARSQSDRTLLQRGFFPQSSKANRGSHWLQSTQRTAIQMLGKS